MSRRLPIVFAMMVLASVPALSGCSSHAHPALVPYLAPASAGGASANLSQQPDAGTKGTLAFTIAIPTPPPTAHGRISASGSAKGYISPATKGMTLRVTGTSNRTFSLDLTSNNPNCIGNPLICTIQVALNPGSYKASVKLFDLAPVGGTIPSNANLLSTEARIPFSITIGTTTFITPHLKGVEATLSISNLPHPCSSSPPTPFTVTAKDADGYTIAGRYALKITLTDSDTSGATAIATSGKDNPPPNTLWSSSDVATIAWNGNTIPGGSATIGATAQPNVSTTAQFAVGVVPGVAQFVPDGTAGQSFTAPACITNIFVYELGAQGAPGAGAPGLALPGLGGLIVANFSVTPGQTFAIFVATQGQPGSLFVQGFGGFVGGGDGAVPQNNGWYGGSGGGGATVFWDFNGLRPTLVAAGGGGGDLGVDSNHTGNGGDGGGFNGGDGGAVPLLCQLQTAGSGGGGTQDAGGSSPPGGNPGQAGQGGVGVSGCPFGLNPGSAGGGGGWYGGGGGVGGGAGGGGSSHAADYAMNVETIPAVNSGDGFLTICYGYSNNQCGPSNRLLKAYRFLKRK